MRISQTGKPQNSSEQEYAEEQEALLLFEHGDTSHVWEMLLHYWNEVLEGRAPDTRKVHFSVMRGLRSLFLSLVWLSFTWCDALHGGYGVDNLQSFRLRCSVSLILLVMVKIVCCRWFRRSRVRLVAIFSPFRAHHHAQLRSAIISCFVAPVALVPSVTYVCFRHPYRV